VKKRPEPARPPHRDLMRLAEAAALVACHRRTLDRKIRTGELPAYRVGRGVILVDLNDVMALVVRIPAAQPAPRPEPGTAA